MKIKVYNQEGKEMGYAELPKEIFEVPMNRDLLHQAVVAQTANARVARAHTKGRGEVRGGGKKPWKQKGTGRARHGSIRSPIWIGGGVTFGPTKDRNFSKKINKKMKRKALFIALSSKVKDEEIILLDELKPKEPKTKEMARILQNLTTDNRRLTTDKTLVVVPAKDELVVRVNRNIPTTKTLRADSLNVRDILSYKYLLMPKKSIEIIKEKIRT